jgi:hypothetical protein
MSENYWGKNAIELHYVDCEHTRFIPRDHTADHRHCYGCHPELAKVPLPGCCETCQFERERVSYPPASPGDALTGTHHGDGDLNASVQEFER